MIRVDHGTDINGIPVALFRGDTYPVRDVLRSYGGVWSHPNKVWRVTEEFGPQGVDALIARLRRDGWDVTGARARPAPRSGSVTWADALLSAAGKVSPELGRSVFHALARVLHPDAGGDTRLMQALNDARSRIEVASRAST